LFDLDGVGLVGFGVAGVGGCVIDLSLGKLLFKVARIKLDENLAVIDVFRGDVRAFGDDINNGCPAFDF
jgi:hypothetical protein